MLSHATNTISKMAVKHGPAVGKYALQVGVSTAKTAIGVASTVIAFTAGMKLSAKAIDGVGYLRERFKENKMKRELEELRKFAETSCEAVVTESTEESVAAKSTAEEATKTKIDLTGLSDLFQRVFRKA
jgi:hypothetical protein